MRRIVSLLRIVLRFPVAFVATFGLLVVPVECSVAAGPHSIFVDAGSIATLQVQAGTSPAAATHAHSRGDEHVTSQLAAIGQDLSQAMPMQMFVPEPAATKSIHDHEHHSGSPGDTDSGQSPAKASPPRTAGFASDSIVALLLPGIESVQATAPPILLDLTDFQMPPDHLLRGPEPPPG